ncbi:MAG: aspartate/glutamate racemase family protein, partial [Clostridia bacterium]|nr:aspartate/glutamate racemase family protein [Clostridia bacterium]
VSEIVSLACPMFVPLVESWHPSADDTATNAIVSEYLAPISNDPPAAVILGCTHYPLLTEVIKKHLPESALISSGAEAANALSAFISENGLANRNGGRTEFYTSGGAELFSQNANTFLRNGREINAVHIDIEKF